MATQGIDVSKHNGIIDWAKVKASGKVEFVMIRACYGWDNDNQIDNRFRANAEGCAKNGIPFGFYHYSYAHTPDDARREAAFFLRVIDGQQPSYPLAFDFEEPTQVGGKDAKGTVYKGLEPAVQLEIIDTFLAEIEKAAFYGQLYSSASILQRLRQFAPARIDKYDCWVAHVETPKPGFDGSYGIWQYSWKGLVDGIGGTGLDLNYAYKDYPAIIKAAGLNGFVQSGAGAEKPEEKPSTVTLEAAGELLRKAGIGHIRLS